MQIRKLTDDLGKPWWLIFRDGEIAEPLACLTDHEWQRFCEQAIAADPRILEVAAPAASAF